MDSRRFDNWTRNRALRLSRRDALRLAGAGGAAAALASRPLDSLAQSTCTLLLHGETIGGPSTSTAYDGALTFSVGADGALTNASFTPNGGTAATVSGSLAGRAIDLSITLSAGRTLALSGATDQKSPSCPSAAAGVLAGPQPGDLGGWKATGGGTTFAPVTTSGQSTNNQPAGTGCQAPSFACGTNCCPGGASCTNATQGICVCPGGTTQCGLNCVPNCPDGQPLDLDSCSCQSACSPDQSPCQLDTECCNGFCDITSGTCASCAGLVCGDMGCVDPTTDPNNCGTCGNVCVDDTGFCLGGVCQCIPDNEPKGSSSSSCCSKGYVSTTGLCGCALLGEWCGATGECCDNATRGALCVTSTSGFLKCCLSSGTACTADSECCFDMTCVNGTCTDL